LRAAVFAGAGLRAVGDLRTAAFAAGLRDAVFRVAVFAAAVFFTAAFFAAVFLAADFFATLFFAAVFLPGAAFFATAFLAAAFFAGVFPAAAFFVAAFFAATFFTALPEGFFAAVRLPVFLAEDFFAADLRVVAMRVYSCGGGQPSMGVAMMTRT
jgi:hypothetical protein